MWPVSLNPFVLRRNWSRNQQRPVVCLKGAGRFFTPDWWWKKEQQKKERGEWMAKCCNLFRRNISSNKLPNYFFSHKDLCWWAAQVFVWEKVRDKGQERERESWKTKARMDKEISESGTGLAQLVSSSHQPNRLSEYTHSSYQCG